MWSDWLSVVIAFLALLLSGWSAWSARRDARAAAVSASAAERSAEAQTKIAAAVVQGATAKQQAKVVLKSRDARRNRFEVSNAGQGQASVVVVTISDYTGKRWRWTIPVLGPGSTEEKSTADLPVDDASGDQPPPATWYVSIKWEDASGGGQSAWSVNKQGEIVARQ